jgi:hypothetical protein
MQHIKFIERRMSIMDKPTINVEEYISEQGIELIKSPEGETYLKKENKLHPTNSQFVRDMFALAHKNAFGTFPKLSQEKEYVRHLELLARSEGREHQLHLRVAAEVDYFWYDLGDKVVKIGAGESRWEVVENSPVYFRKYGNTSSQKIPVNDDNTQLRNILQFVNLANDEDKLLFQVYLVSCFIPGIAHPIPIFFGEKGAAKSTAMRLLRKLVDPAKEELISLLRSQKDFAQVLAHNYMPAFDNMGKLTPALSDMLCCAVTGGAIHKRRLYTDDDDVVIPFKSCVTANGVNLMATKSDLLDRSILFEVTRIDESQRRTEEEFWELFETQRPALLGAIFDVLSDAMGLMHSGITMPSIPRMADFAKWGYAIAEAAGLGGKDFLAAYSNNINKVHDAVIAEDPVAESIVNFMEQEAEWSGYATALLGVLSAKNPTYILPKLPNALSRRIKEIASNLRAKGIDCEFTKDTTENKTKIKLSHINVSPVTPVTPVGSSIDESTENMASGDGGDTGDIGGELAETV